MAVRDYVRLDERLRIGRGGVRDVYRHPVDGDKCVKVIFNTSRLRSVNREINYLKWYRFLRKPFTHLYKFYGRCNTNFGPGGVYELVRDYDGHVSVTLDAHLKNEPENPLQPSEVIRLLNELYEHLLKYRIIICDPAPHNLMVQKVSPRKNRLVIIDGIGNPQFIKSADVLTPFAHRTIRKKWNTYVKINPVLDEVLQKEARNCVF